MNKNLDFKSWNPTAERKSSINRDTILSITILVAMIIITFSDWRERVEIIDTANQIISERDDRIDQLENIIDQIYMQNSLHNMQHQNGNTLI